jgi:hypothetical protein
MCANKKRKYDGHTHIYEVPTRCRPKGTQAGTGYEIVIKSGNKEAMTHAHMYNIAVAQYLQS